MMDSAVQFLTENLPGHQVQFSKRPDGKLLMTLSQDGETVYMKALESKSVSAEAGLRELVREIQRDRKLVSGEISWKGHGAQWLAQQLPTFTGAALNPTAAKTLWNRRVNNRRIGAMA